MYTIKVPKQINGDPGMPKVMLRNRREVFSGTKSQCEKLVKGKNPHKYSVSPDLSEDVDFDDIYPIDPSIDPIDAPFPTEVAEEPVDYSMFSTTVED